MSQRSRLPLFVALAAWSCVSNLTERLQERQQAGLTTPSPEADDRDGDSGGDRDGDRDGDAGGACSAVDGGCTPSHRCEAGSYVVSEATRDGDIACDPCPPGTFSSEVDATSCAAWTPCLPGEYVATVGSGAEDQVCKPCPEGQTSDAEDSATCYAADGCASGTEPVAAANGDDPPVCKECLAGQYCAGGVTPAADCSAGTWDHDANPSTPCAPHTPCPAGTHVSEPGGSLNDQTCAPCAAGTFSTSTNALACRESIECAPGTYVSAEDSDSLDADCRACPSNSYSATMNAPSCSAWTDCEPGQYVANPGSDTTDRVCDACSAGEFSSAANAPACQPWQTCPAGTYVETVGTSAGDRLCSECPAGQFSAATNSSSCAAWTVCDAPDLYQSTPPSATADRECSSCSPPEQTSADNETSCTLPAFQMSDGQVVIEAENYDATVTNGDPHSWNEATVSGFSNNAAMSLDPDTGMYWDTNITTTAPRLDYSVNFTSAGSFYLHVRGAGGNPAYEADSCWAGLNGTLTAAFYDFMNLTSSILGWRTQAITVSETGIQTLSVWAREDGFLLDKLVVNSSSTPPTGDGPAESPRN